MDDYVCVEGSNIYIKCVTLKQLEHVIASIEKRQYVLKKAYLPSL